MQHLFLDKELSQLAKDKGFDDECLASHNSIHGFVLGNEQFTSNQPAPLYQQIIDWFREKHKIIIVIDFYNDGNEWLDTRFKIKISEFKHFKTHDSFVLNEINSYYEALDKAIEEAFKLI